MKKTLLALAALTAFAGVASAQSSVTLFGVVDLAARNTKNGSAGSIKSLTSGNNATSRLGFRGIEDIGGGMRAGFWIEGELLPDTGNAGGQTWQRRSTVSLLGGFGELRLGRDYTPTFWNHTVFDPFGTNGVGSQLNLMIAQGGSTVLNGGATTTVRASNTIGYFLPTMGGLYGQAMVAAGENVPGNKYLGGRLGYAAGPVNVAVAYGKTEITGSNDMTAANIGASFNLGFLTLFGQYHRYDLDVPNRELTNAMLGATVPLGAGTFKASFGKSSSNNSDFDATQIAVGYVYDLSKRTALYTHFSRVNNDGSNLTGARFTAGGAGPTFRAGGQTSTGYEFGVRHSF